MKSNCVRIALSIMGTLLLAAFPQPGAFGSFELVENFNDLELGPIDGQDTWNVSGLGGTVEVLPGAGINQVLEVTVDTGVLTRELAIPDGQTRMFFMRFRFDGQHNYSFGLSQLASPTEYSDFGPELRRTSALDRLEIHDGARYQLLTTLEPLLWYNLWALVNNDTGNTQVWLHSRLGQDALASDQLAADGQTVFDFRTDLDRDLIRFYIKAADGGSGRDPLWIDDLYLENSDAVNLVNPAAPIPGDFDQNGVVDGRDFLSWQRGESPVPFSATDLADWQSSYGATPLLSATLMSIPEPANGIGLIAAVAIVLRPRWRAAYRSTTAG